MRRVVLIIPSFLSPPGSPSVLRRSMPGLAWLTERGTLRKCAAAEQTENPARGLRTTTPEAAYLGLDPNSLTLQDGPLTVSALGADPPSGSVQFHLTLMALSEGEAHVHRNRVPDEDLRAVLDASRKLNTKALTIVDGEQFDHGLVWEDGSLDLGVFPPDAIEGKPIEKLLPEGDGERLLRRFIDDSVNLLNDLEVNRRRQEEGQSPLNLWWPWGQGMRVHAPNLALGRGEVATVESRSMRLQGLARLCGYRHGRRESFGWGVRTNLGQVLDNIGAHSASIAYIDAFIPFRESERWEEMEWFANELDRKLFQPIAEVAKREPLRLTIAACPTGAKDERFGREGLLLNFQSGAPAANTFPFDERALEERALGTTSAWQAIAESLD